MSGGEADPLIQRLRPALDDALQVDLAIAFIFDAGVNLLHSRLVDILGRPGSLVRIITGDYHGVTEPNALRHLLALPGIANPNVSPPALHLRAYRVKPDRKDSFHPKAWIVHGHDKGLAWIGSSNLSETALVTGLEWSYEIVSIDGLLEARAAFDELWGHPATEPIDADWIDAYERTRRPPTRGGEALPVAVAEDAPVPAAEPRPGIQREALASLALAHAKGERAGLVVLATGLGKTYVSAFDSRTFRRVLFVAHREEILTQAFETFRKVRPSARMGFYNGADKDSHADVIFASVQTLSGDKHLEAFEPDHFDYIVIDEFHHAGAETYRRVLDRFEPEFLLGLTATPDRTDGFNILSLCDGNEIYRADMPRGIQDGQLSPFRYFGIGDPTEYENRPWGTYTLDRLAATVAIESRARHILETLAKHAPGRVRALAFCVTTGHADFMADYFVAHGRKCAAVYAGSQAPRTASLESLARGDIADIEVVFCVDMFNEGVDIPNVDTVMMLRPTESSIVWLQQLGRGLRRVEGKTLTVLDFIGNHDVFLRRPEMLFETLKIEIEGRVELWRPEFRAVNLPPGVEISFDLKAQDILTQLRKQSAKAGTKGERWYDEFYNIHDERPTALEAWRAGWLKVLSDKGGGWLGFVRSRGHRGLDPDHLGAFEQHRPFFDELEASKGTNSLKFLALRALLHLDPFPGRVRKRAIAEWIATRARRSAAIMREFAEDGTDAAAVEHALETGAFAELAQLGEGAFLRHDAKFVDASRLATGSARALARLVGELVDLHLERWLEDASKSSMKLPKMVGDDGAEIDARFDIEIQGERSTIVFHSGGDKSERNPQYHRGLATILLRLSRAEIDIERIEVDSAELVRRRLPISERTLAIKGHTYPLVMKQITDQLALGDAIKTAMRKVGQEPGKSGGNDRRRLRITLVQDVPAGELWRRLHGPATTDAGRTRAPSRQQTT